MEKKSIHEITSTVCKALTLEWELRLWCCPVWTNWKRNLLLCYLASALPAQALLCWRSDNENCSFFRCSW